MTDDTPGLLFIVNSLEVGGAEKQVVTLLNHLEDGCFRLHLAYLKRGELLLPQLNTRKLDEVLCCDVARPIDLAALGRLRSLIAARRIDAVVCTNTYSMLYGYLATAGSSGHSRPKPKLVTVFHTTLLRSYKEKAQMLLYQRLFRSCDLLLYVCENQRLFWRERGLRPAHDGVVYNGIDTDHFTDLHSPDQKLALRQLLGFGPRDYVVGICSALRPEKAHMDLLQGIARLRSQSIPAKVLVVGDGPERAAIERGAEALGLRDHMRITGVQADVRPYIACCDVMALVSRSIETFSLAALESMSLGKPLVLTDIGGASEQVIHGQNGFLFEPGDIDALVLHLSSLTSEALRVQMGQAGARRVRELFTVDSMTVSFIDQIEQILGPGPGRGSRRPREHSAPYAGHVRP